MRYFVTGEQQRQLLLNALILMFLGYIALLWLTNGMMYFHKMGLTPESVIAYYLGSEENFAPPRSYQGLLEVAHFHLFAMGILVLTLTHLMLMTRLSVALKIWLSGLTYVSAIFNEAAGWLVRFVHPDFAYFKIGSFLTLELTLLVLIIAVGGSLFKARHSIDKEKKAHDTSRSKETPEFYPGD
jgi:hypothetical protein